MDEKKTKIKMATRWVAGLSGALLIGALGSGLWEVAMKPTLMWIGTRLIEAAAFLWGGTLDSIYADVGAGNSERLVVLPFILSSVALLTLPVAGAILVNGKVKDLQERWKRIKNRPSSNAVEELPPIEKLLADADARLRSLNISTKWFLLPGSLAVSLGVATITAEVLYVREASNWIERSIQIVAPAIAPVEHLQLLADYKAINSTKDYFVLDKKLRKIASTNGRVLPTFEGIGNADRVKTDVLNPQSNFPSAPR